MIQSGKYGEYLVMLELLKLDFETYMANIKNQEHWDLTIILNDSIVKRIQVKTTELQNKATNNSIKSVDKNYDYMIIVIIDNDNPSFYILSKEDVIKSKGSNKQLSISKKVRNQQQYIVKNEVEIYKDKWDRLKEL